MKLSIVFWLALLPVGVGHGQVRIGEPGAIVRLTPDDAAIFEAHERRSDLSCAVSPVQPELGFDLSMHTGYELSVPIDELAGKGNSLSAIFQVTAANLKDNPTYFYQTWAVPEIAEGSKGLAHLRGRFVLGEGRYQIDWLMRDKNGRLCSARWQINANPHSKDRRVELRLPPGTAAAAPEPFVPETPAKPDTPAGLRVVVLLHAASRGPGTQGMGNEEIPPVMSILRNIAREPRIGNYSVVAFNLERRQVIFRRERTPDIDFPALGTAIDKAQLSTIDAKRFRQYDSEPQFLGSLLADEMAQNNPDAVIFVGPKAVPEFSVRGALKPIARPNCPVFYLAYIADPLSNPWRDLIGSAIKLWKGIEYTITKPRDLSAAWNEVMSHIAAQDPVNTGTDHSQMESSVTAKK